MILKIEWFDWGIAIFYSLEKEIRGIQKDLQSQKKY